MLRTALSDYVTAEEALAGFVLQAPNNHSKLHVLLDRSGFVLARTRSVEDCVAIVVSHLAVFLPQPPETIRLNMRALVNQDSEVTLACFPLFVDPPLTERRVERTSHRIIDRLAVDLNLDGTLQMTPMQSSISSSARTTPGHTPAPLKACNVVATLLPQSSVEPPSVAAAVALLAASMSTGTRIQRIALAERLTMKSLRPVQIMDRSARYAALQQ